MSTVAAPKSHRRRKFKPELSFLHSSSSGASSTPFNKKPNPAELVAPLTRQRKVDEGERRCGVGGSAAEPPVFRRCSKGELLTTPGTTPSDKYEARPSSGCSAKPSDGKDCEQSGSEVVENETSFLGAGEAILDEKPKPKALAESDVVMRKMRQVHLENDLCEEEDDLLDDLPLSWQARLILEGAPTAVLRRGSAHQALHDGLYSFVVHHRDLDHEDDECGALYLIRDAATTGSRLSRSNHSGRQCAVAGDVGPLRARVPFLRVARINCESAADGEERKEEPNEGRLQPGTPSLPRCQPRAPCRRRRKRAMPMPQVEVWDKRRWFAEMSSSLRRGSGRRKSPRLKEEAGNSVRGSHIPARRSSFASKIEKLL